MRFHKDDRGTRYCDIFPEIGKGDINITIVEPHAAALWHRHKFQSDWQFVVKGSLKVGVCNLPQYKDEDFARYPQQMVDFIEESKKEWTNTYKPIYQKSLKNYENISIGKLTNKKVAMVFGDEPQCHWHYLSEHNANEGALFIPSGLWHGCYNYTNEPAILAYHITNKWDGSDEERVHPLKMGWNYEREVK